MSWLRSENTLDAVLLGALAVLAVTDQLTGPDVLVAGLIFLLLAFDQRRKKPHE